MLVEDLKSLVCYEKSLGIFTLVVRLAEDGKSVEALHRNGEYTLDVLELGREEDVPDPIGV